MDDGDFPSCEAVEESGLPDIRASDDGDGGHGAYVTAENADVQGWR
jgi:hypothetical protein